MLIVLLLLVSPTAAAQRKGAPLENAAIISMVKGGMPDSMIVSVIQSSETQFDVSAEAFTELKQAGVNQRVIDAMVATRAPIRGPAPVRVISSGATPASHLSRQQPPYVLLVHENAKYNTPVERAQITQVKTNKKDLNSLAAEGVVARALQGVAAEAVASAAKSQSAVGGSLAQAASGAMGGLFKKRKPTVTYVWGLAGRNSSTTLTTNTPKFEVFYGGIPGVNADEYVPAIVRLVPTRENWRLVGAARGQTDAGQRTDWKLYSSFVEEKLASRLNKLAPGQIEIEPQQPLPAGEYALVLRPVSKKKKFSGIEVLNSQGEGLLFNSAWTFTIDPE